MSTVIAVPPILKQPLQIEKQRQIALSSTHEILTEVYETNCNLSVWQRTLPTNLTANLNDLLGSDKKLKLVRQVTPDSVFEDIYPHLAEFECAQPLITDIAQLVDMFCCLFELKQAGLRLSILDKAMCPRFHVDKVPCRLITTYLGAATQWLPHKSVNRKALGAVSPHLSEQDSKLFNHAQDICQLSAGDVALVKGETWPDNENAGLVHRSPPLNAGKRRLLLTLDMMH